MLVMAAEREVEWRVIEELLEAKFGWGFDDTRRPILEARLERRVEALGLLGAMDYYHYLRFHPSRDEEAEQIKTLVTNNETYFFRADYQRKILTGQLVSQLAPGLDRPLRVLSAGCSSGEEAYSLAIGLQEVEHRLPHGFEVDGFDLSPSRIEQGRRAVYHASSLRACDDMARRGYFMPNDDDTYQLRSEYRRGVSLFEGNLVGRVPPTPHRYDVAFCRNVLIYLSELGVNRALATLANCVRPGGYLFVGHAESLLGKKVPFEPTTFEDAIAYRRSEGT
jgi:chemotaxis protein methyltransferase CheR